MTAAALLACSALALQGAQSAQTDPTPQVKAAMDKIGLTYTNSSSGLSYIVDFSHPGDRTRRVFISTRRTGIQAAKIHTIYTMVWEGKEPPSEDLMNLVFWRASKKLGGFYVFKEPDNKGYTIRFSATFDATDLPDTLTAESKEVVRLKDTIYFVNQVGEETWKSIKELGS